MHCSNCGHQLTTGASFCGNCGVQIAQAPPSHTAQYESPQQQQPANPPQSPINQPPLPPHLQPSRPGQQPVSPASQPYYPPAQPVQLHPSSKYNEMAIIAAVVLFFFPPVSFILGIISLNQIKQSHERGRGLAIASIVIGGIVIALFVLYLVILAAYMPDA